jgi:hypothetical protein
MNCFSLQLLIMTLLFRQSGVVLCMGIAIIDANMPRLRLKSISNCGCLGSSGNALETRLHKIYVSCRDGFALLTKDEE